jgi:hypothetical protein
MTLDHANGPRDRSQVSSGSRGWRCGPGWIRDLDGYGTRTHAGGLVQLTAFGKLASYRRPVRLQVPDPPRYCFETKKRPDPREVFFDVLQSGLPGHGIKRRPTLTEWACRPSRRACDDPCRRGGRPSAARSGFHRVDRTSCADRRPCVAPARGTGPVSWWHSLRSPASAALSRRRVRLVEPSRQGPGNSVQPPEHQRPVGPPESETVRHHRAQRRVAGFTQDREASGPRIQFGNIGRSGHEAAA